jgi:hypothetical protein
MITSSDVKVDNKGRCSLAFKSLREIPFSTIGKTAPRIVELDLSHNNLSDLPRLDFFANLTSLVLDHNRIQSNLNFNNGQPLPRLSLLWVNSNKIKNLSVFIEKVKECCPNLKYFSMLKNDACPNFFNGGTVEQYEDYRLFVLSRLTQLVVLDSTPVTQQERDQAKERYGDLKIQPIVKLKEERRQQKKILEEKKKQEEEKERQKQREELLKQRNSVNIPKNILPDVKELVVPPPQPPSSLLTRESMNGNNSNLSETSDDDTDLDANDEQSFASQLDTAVANDQKMIKGVAVTTIPTPFLIAEQKSKLRYASNPTAIANLPDPSELSATTTPMTALQQSIPRLRLGHNEDDDTES